MRSNSPTRSPILTSLLPPPRQKIRPKSPSQNKDHTPSPGHSSPRPRIRSLIVVSLRLAAGRCGLIRPPGCILRPLSYPPPPKKSTKIPFEKRRCHAIPRPFQTPPPRMLVECGVVEVGDRAVWSNSPSRSQIKTSILPPPPKKSTKIPFKKRRCHAIPRPFQPPPPRTLVDCGVVEVGGRAVRSNSPARLHITTSFLPPPAKKIDQNPF